MYASGALALENCIEYQVFDLMEYLGSISDMHAVGAGRKFKRIRWNKISTAFHRESKMNA